VTSWNQKTTLSLLVPLEAKCFLKRGRGGGIISIGLFKPQSQDLNIKYKFNAVSSVFLGQSNPIYPVNPVYPV
jgi:hypothetical protein